MSTIDRSEKPDGEVKSVLDVLAPYDQVHPNAVIEGRRQNPFAIGVRIIDPDFEGTDRLDRENEIWKLINTLPEELISDITFLLLLTPDEAKRSFASLEFDDPIPSRL